MHMNDETRRYETSELELAAFLKARGHHLLSAKPVPGKGYVNFTFADNGTCEDAQCYFEGAEISARELFTEHRGLRALIRKVKEYNAQIGSEHSDGYKSRRY